MPYAVCAVQLHAGKQLSGMCEATDTLLPDLSLS